MNSYSSKIEEIVIVNDNGIATFENVTVENIRTPHRHGEPRPESRFVKYI